MIVAAGRLLGIAVAAQVGADHGEFLRQSRRHSMPRKMIERIPVHQQHRRAAAADHRHDARAAGLDIAAFEAVEHFITSPDLIIRKPVHTFSRYMHYIPKYFEYSLLISSVAASCAIG